MIENNNIYIIPTSREERLVRICLNNGSEISTVFREGTVYSFNHRNCTMIDEEAYRNAINQFIAQPINISYEIPYPYSEFADISSWGMFDDFKPKNINRRIMK